MFAGLDNPEQIGIQIAAPSLFFFMIKKMPPPTSPQMQQSASKPPTVSGARDTRCKLSRVALWRCEGGEVRGGV